MVLINEDALRKARELLWYGKATVIGYAETLDPITKTTVVNPTATLYTDIPCKLSHTKIQSNTQTNGPAILQHAIKVSIGDEYVLPPGCKFIIAQSGKTETYKQSGEPAMFIVHQEIPLVVDGKYA